MCEVDAEGPRNGGQHDRDARGPDHGLRALPGGLARARLCAPAPPRHEPPRPTPLTRFPRGAGFIVDDLVEPELLDRLEAAAWGAWGKVQSGEVTIADNTPDGISLNGLLAPEFGEDSAPFAEHLASAAVERYARAFLGDKLRLGFIGLWVSDSDSAYDSTWHRVRLYRQDCPLSNKLTVLTAGCVDRTPTACWTQITARTWTRRASSISCGPRAATPARCSRAAAPSPPWTARAACLPAPRAK